MCAWQIVFLIPAAGRLDDVLLDLGLDTQLGIQIIAGWLGKEEE